MNFDQFPAWLADWRKIGDGMQRAYWLFLLFTDSSRSIQMGQNHTRRPLSLGAE